MFESSRKTWKILLVRFWQNLRNLGENLNYFMRPVLKLNKLELYILCKYFNLPDLLVIIRPYLYNGKHDKNVWSRRYPKCSETQIFENMLKTFINNSLKNIETPEGCL